MAAPAIACEREPSKREFLKSQREFIERIVARLIDAEIREQNPHFADDLRQAKVFVMLTLKGDELPFVTASYVVFGCHPDQVWARLVADRKAKLAWEFEFWYDENGMLKPDLPIADYDPTCGRPPRLPYEKPRQELPTVPDGRKRPKSPVRLVLSREPIGGGLYNEVLECGHRHLGLGDNAKRRRCGQCQNQEPIEKKPVCSVTAEDIAKIRIRFA